MSEYTPTKLEVRSKYAEVALGPDEYLDHIVEFDRWLEAHNAEVIKETEERIIKLLENPYYHHTFFGPRDVNDEPVILHDGECIGCTAISEIKGEQK